MNHRAAIPPHPARPAPARPAPVRPAFVRGAAAGRPGGSFRRRPARRGPGAAARAHRPAGPSAVTPPDAVPPAPAAAAPAPAVAVPATPAVPVLPTPLPAG
ncbi:hypothetical protein ACFRFU_48700 [Streptomyces sp. NPDC056704]|uniref:hypothetical protein n=1 Tax=Streptomyces sp. NPDC056704 TaxID=3345917 RepID=UPI0036CF35E4